MASGVTGLDGTPTFSSKSKRTRPLYLETRAGSVLLECIRGLLKYQLPWALSREPHLNREGLAWEGPLLLPGCHVPASLQ